MTIYGISQTLGVERLLSVESADGGIMLHVHEKPDADQERIVVAVEPIVELLADPPVKSVTMEGTAQGVAKMLDIHVKRNEVLLCVRSAAGAGSDIAVGFDDFQDAIEAAA